MSNFIGSLVTKTNTVPTFSSAPGRWTVTEAAKYVANGTWPGSLVIDPYFNQTSLLLSCDSVESGQNNTFIDSSSNNLAITRAGNTTQGSFNPYGDRWSNYFSAVATDFLTFPSNAAVNLTTSNFTFECWFNRVSASTSTATNLIWWNGNSNSNSICGLRVQISNTGVVELLCSENGTSWQLSVQSTATCSNNIWNHIAVVRNGQTVTVYLNGISVVSGSLSSAGASLYAGTINYLNNMLYSTGTWKMIGYMSDVRLVLGSALYTGTFIPPITPLTTLNGTAALLTCQSNRFKDSSTNNFAVTATGDVKVRPNSPYAPSTVYKPANGASAYYDGTEDNLTIPASAVNVFTGNFTLEGWYYLNSTATEFSVYIQGASPFFAININAAGYRVYLNSVTPTITTTTTIQAGCWNHVALTRSGSTVTVYHNGVSAGTASTSAVLGYSVIANIKIDINSGYLSDVRIVNGAATFTSVPTAPLTAVANTTVLLNFKNASIVDATGKNNLETVGGAMTVTGRKKWGSGAMYFDGNGDYLTIPYNQDINITVGDFTVEGWVYFNSVSEGQHIFTNYNAGTSYGIALYTQTAGTLNYFLGNTGTSWNIANAVSMGNVVVEQWYHFALVRSGSNFTPYINGVAGTTTTSSSALFNGSLPYIVGAQGTGVLPFNGYLDDFRISKIARYTAAFTPPNRAHGTL